MIPFRERNPVKIGAVSIAVLLMLLVMAFRADSLPLNRIASSTPGTPTATKATRQERYCARKPPMTAPTMVPSGMPKE